MKYNVILILGLIAQISFSQGKIKIKDADLDSLELKFHKLEYTGFCRINLKISYYLFFRENPKLICG